MSALQTHPYNEFSQGKTCFHYRDPYNENRVPCNGNRFFPVRISLQGKPCFNYKDGFAVYFTDSLTKTFGLLIYTLFSDLGNQGQCQTLEKFQVLQTLIFFRVTTLKKKLGYTTNQKKNSGGHPEKIQFLKTLILGWQPT
jgi:hypothetical protein